MESTLVESKNPLVDIDRLLRADDVKRSPEQPVYGRDDYTPSTSTRAKTLHKSKKSSSPIQVDSENYWEEKVEGAVDTLIDILRMFGLEYPSEATANSIRGTKAFWKNQIRLCNGDWMGYLKWKLADYFHANTDQLSEPPPSPKGIKKEIRDLLLTGAAGRWLRAVLRSSPINKKMEILSSLSIGGKKGMPRPGVKEMQADATATFEALTRVKVQPPNVESLELSSGKPWGEIKDFKFIEDSLSRETVIKQLERTVDELFAKHDWKSFCKSKDFLKFPSMSSTNESTRSEGGAYGEIAKLAHEMGYSSYNLKDLKPITTKSGKTFEMCADFVVDPKGRGWNKGTDQFKPSGYVLGKSFCEFRKLESERTDFSSRQKDEERIEHDVTHVFTYDRLQSHFTDFYNHLLHEVKAEPETYRNSVQVVSLSEALKVRAITKGSSVRSFLLSPLQEFMHGILRKHPVFQLIGSGQVTHEILLNTLSSVLYDDEAYLSGDYKGATNNLAPWVSETIARRIAKVTELPAELEELFIEALTKHLIEDPDAPDNVLPQQWGQLMGSIVSFPVLCIANAAVCRWTMEVSFSRRIPLSKAQLLINGDDCLFKLPIHSLNVWKLISNFVGLIPSIGKYYFSRTILQINSVNFIRVEPYGFDTKDRENRDIIRFSVFRIVKYINMGLFYGLGRSSSAIRSVGGKKTDEGKLVEDWTMIPVRAHELLNWCPDDSDIQFECYQMFLDHHRNNLTKLYANIPWFVPENLGGAGLPIFINSNGDLDLALKFNKLNERLGFKFIRFLPAGRERNWCPTDTDLRLLHQMKKEDRIPGKLPSNDKFDLATPVSMRFPTKPMETSDEYLLDQNDRINGILAVDGIFSNLLSNAWEGELRLKKIIKVKQLWSSLFNSGSYPTPVSLSTVGLWSRIDIAHPVEILGMKRERYDLIKIRNSRELVRDMPQYLENERLINALW